ncbi:MAG: DnaJ domain-containing protein [Myxococcota bacterium]
MEAADLPDLLLDLSRRGFRGTLILRRDGVEKRIDWVDGLPVRAQSSRPSEALGCFLRETGRLGAEQESRLARHLRRAGGELGAVLELRLLAPLELLHGVHEHLRRCLLEVFAWPELESELLPSEANGDGAAGLDLLPLLQEGIESHWSAERLVASLDEQAPRRASASERMAGVLPRLRSCEGVERMIAMLDGSQSLAQCLHAGGTPRALATAWLLDRLGLIDYADATVAPQSEEETFSIEIVLAPEPSRSRTEGTGSGRSEVPRDEEGEAEALRGVIEQLHEGLTERDHYELLGVPPSAAQAEIRTAYRKAAKRLHPDAVVRLGLRDLKEKANEVFSRISRAHAVLTDAGLRREYDASRDPRGSDEADRLARAEILYRKAAVLLRAGRFAEAVPLLEPCISLWPEEPTYHSDLGWALFKLPDPPLDRARAALDRAIALDPEAAEALFRLSFVLTALGDDDAARGLRARAQRMDPTLR